MSRLRQPNGDDHPEAARKHLDDTSVLSTGNRPDGAAYLAGYVVECSLKSLVLLEGGTPWGHDLNALSRDALRLAALPGARTARYIPRMTPGHTLYDPQGGWRETIRYRAPGCVDRATAASWVGEAQAIFESTIVPMQLDGVI